MAKVRSTPQERKRFATFLNLAYANTCRAYADRNERPPNRKTYAAMLGVPETSYSAWANQERLPNRASLRQLEKTLGPEVWEAAGIATR